MLHSNKDVGMDNPDMHNNFQKNFLIILGHIEIGWKVTGYSLSNLLGAELCE